MLLWFICSCTCTMTIEGQQHETVTTTTTTTQSNLHKLHSVQELIFPIQQLNVKWDGGKTLCHHDPKPMSSWPDIMLLLVTRCHYQGVNLSCMNTSSENMSSFSSVNIVWRWPNSDLGHQMSLARGKLELQEHFIWKYELILLCTCHLKMT